MSGRHLAQINVALMRAPLDDPVMAGFVALLDEVNAVADTSPGFVWRLRDEGGDATSIRAFADPNILVNLSVWESIEVLRAYVYRSSHLGPLRQRRHWFAPYPGPHLALWWLPAGDVPTVDEGKRRLDLLAAAGPTKDAFTFRDLFDSQGAPVQSSIAAARTRSS